MKITAPIGRALVAIAAHNNAQGPAGEILRPAVLARKLRFGRAGALAAGALLRRLKLANLITPGCKLTPAGFAALSAFLKPTGRVCGALGAGPSAGCGPCQLQPAHTNPRHEDHRGRGYVTINPATAAK